MSSVVIEQPIASRPAGKFKAALTLGIVGGGQLARMLGQAAIQLGCELVILERAEGSPASQLARETLIGDWDNQDALLKLASKVDVVTLENEFVDADSLAALERAGHTLWPTVTTIRTVQDKLVQKGALAGAGLPVAEFAAAPDKVAVLRSAEKFGWPVVLKKRRNGYDGKGNFTLRSAEELDAAWGQLDGTANALYVEKLCPFTLELATMVIRSPGGETAGYPVVETIQREHICHVVKAPAVIPAEMSARAAELARKAVAAVGCVGAMGIEMFLGRDGQILINELAPRVHNSGHYTIEGCVCSQFENHVRAVMGWPLGSTAMVSPAAVMINLLGAGRGPGAPQGLSRALEVAGAHLHVYGKSVSAAGRKMGHITALGGTVEDALAVAQQAAGFIRFGGET